MSWPVPARRASVAGRPGFTLVEVVTAASLLLLTVACATPLLLESQGAAAHETRAAAAHRLAQSTVERLRGLPFAAQSSPLPATAATPAGCVVGAVFPHADVARNRPDAFFVLGDGGPSLAGTFVTRRRVGAYLVTTESHFAAATADGLAAVSTARLAGYDSSTGDELPSGALDVTVRVSWTVHGGERSVTRRVALLARTCATTDIAAAASP